MFTECPECETTFRLSADDLRRAHGKVRCGECHTVFNALESLAEEPQTERASTNEATSGLNPSWLIDSADNPPGDLDPDLEAYEKTAFLPEDDADFEYEFDDEDDDGGVILYIDDELHDASLGIELTAEPAETDSGEDALPDFDETIWERVPGVAAAQPQESLAPPESREQGIEPTRAAVPEAGVNFPMTTRRESLYEPQLGAEAAAPDEAEANDETAAAQQDEALEVWVAEGGSTLNSAGIDAQGSIDTPDDHYAYTEDAGEDEDEDDYEYQDADEAYAALDADVATDVDTDVNAAQNADDGVSTEAGNEDLEFDVPAENWNKFFGPEPEGPQPIVWEPPSLGPANTATNAAAVAAGRDGATSPSWHGEGAAPAEPESHRRGWWQLTGGLLLLVFFSAQLLHYNRDTLAAHPQYGQWVRSAYATLKQPLYPAWPLLNNYEIRGSEAVVGESGQNVMDIRAQIAAIGEQPTGLPRLRVVLRDRWSNPVAASDFGPTEYAAAGDIPADGMLQPGTVIPARVSIADPGSGVQGFELELCLPRRGTGLECTDQPFK